MVVCNGVTGIEIGQGAGDPQDAVKCARRQAELVDRGRQQCTTLFRQGAMGLYAFLTKAGVCNALAIVLYLPGGQDARTYRRAGFRCAIQSQQQLLVGQAGHLDLDIDAITQRTGDTALVARGLFMAAVRTGAHRIIGIPALDRDSWLQ